MVVVEELLLVWYKLTLLLYMRILQVILKSKIFDVILLVWQILKSIIVKFFRLSKILDYVNIVAVFVLDHLAGEFGGKFADGG